MHYERLWEHDAPQTKGHQLTDVPSLSVHLASRESNTGAAVVVCPGGGYRILAATHEGLHVANALNELGISAFVLRYRVAPRYSSKVSLLDGQRAIRFVRHHAERFRVDSRRLGMLGFSAGGHVTLAVGTSAQSERPTAQDPIDRNSSVPNFLVPIYAVSNGAVRGRKADEYHATDTLVDHSTPPTFLVHTHEDNIVPASQSTLFYNALLKARVPAELHVFGFGEHGVGLASGDPDTHEWLSLLRNWLRRSGFLTPKARVAINQKFDFADDLPDIPHMGWITFYQRIPMHQSRGLDTIRRQTM